MQQEEECYGEILELPSEEPPCSVVSTLRQLVHQGTTLKAQILQLSADIPPAFLETKSEFSPVLADFRYLKSPETENAKLERSNFLKNLHERANESLGDVGFRTFDLLHQVVHYHQQTIELIDNIENGRFTEGPLERICQDQDSLCMLIDILYSVGVILLLVDICLPGLMRERLVVAYVRQNKCVHLILQNEMLQKLCQRTGFVAGARAPQGYPERYLSNFPLPERIVRYVLGLLVQTDIGGILKHFPNPAHRTTAMAQQGAQAFVLLYFVPEILVKDVDFMKQIVERLFSDRWIISWLPGYTANLRLAWDAYRAARSALKNALTGGVRKKFCQQFWDKVDTLCVELERNLKTGGLETDNFLRYSSDIFSLVREANVALQWILLHVFSGEKVPETGDGETVAKLLLNLASWELNLLNMYQDLLDSRHERREIASNLVKDNLRILGESCEAKEGRSSTMKHDSHVLYWLQCLASEVDALSNVSEREAADKIRSVQRAFDDIGSFWPLDNSTTSVRTVIKEIRNNLSVIQQLSNVRQELMDTLRIASDFSYGFCLAQHEKFIKLLQTIIGKDPTCLEKMGCLLIKMRSILAKPESLQPTANEEEEDTLTLFGYYENVLKSFGTKVLDHVPECVCAALDQMALIRTHVQKLTREGKSGEQLSKLGKVFKQSGIKEKTFHDNTKIYGRLAALSSDIALFSTGLKKIENCLKDVMPLTLHGYLEERVRQHIAKRSSLLANQKLQFGNDAPPFTFKNVTLRGSRPIGMGQTFSGVISGKDEFGSCLVDLKDYFDGYLRSLECTHDCLDIPGSGLWHREIAHVIAINLRKEYKGMVKGKSSKGFLKRQLFPDSDSACTFLGRLAREIIRLTSPGTTHYSIQGCYWLDASGNEVFGTSAMESLRLSIGIQGLAALDTLFLARIVKLIEKLHDLCSELCTIQTSAQKPISTYSRELQSCRGLSVPMEGAMWYVEAVYSVGTRNWAPLLEVIAAIGQSQLLRRLIGHVCRNACMLEAPVAFHRAMQALSEFVDNKDVDFASGFMSADLSRAASSSLAKADEASELSGSSFVVGGKESDDDFTSVGDLQSTKQSKRQSIDEQASTLDVSRRDEISNKELVPETLDPGKKDISSLSDDTRINTVNQGSASEPESSARQLDTITETAARSFRRRIGVEPTPPPPLPRAAHPEFYTIDSPNLSASSVRLSDIADSEGATKPTQRLPAEPFGYGNASRTRRPAAFARPSDNSSGYSDGGSLWDPTAFRRRAKKDACDTSVGAQTYTSEASSKPLFPFAVNFDALCGDSTCDILGSLTSNASAPILNEQGPRGVFGILQSTGYLSPMTTRYISECSPAPDVPIILFLATISIVHKYEFNKQSASLMRPLGSTIPDARSFVSGLVTVLFQYVPTITDQFLRHAGQYVRSYLKTATGATAQGIAAAGVKMILPQEVERTAAFVCEMCEVGGWSRKRAERFIPPFLLDVWMLGV